MNQTSPHFLFKNLEDQQNSWSWPCWTPKIEELSEAKDKVEDVPSIENNMELKMLTAKLRVEINSSKKEAWKEKTEKINVDKREQKL